MPQQNLTKEHQKRNFHNGSNSMTGSAILNNIYMGDLRRSLRFYSRSIAVPLYKETDYEDCAITFMKRYMSIQSIYACFSFCFNLFLS